MKITKFGHCCLLVEVEEIRILIDPGSFSSGQLKLNDVDLILITHEHKDHLDLETFKTVVSNNPNAQIRTNSGAGRILTDNGINYKLMENGSGETFKGILVEAVETKHAIIYGEFPSIPNTGYFIDKKLFYPGDALTIPNKPCEILALPVEAPWLKLSDAVDFAKKVKPKTSFPVHDGRLRPDRLGSSHEIPKKELIAAGINFLVLEDNKEYSL